MKRKLCLALSVLMVTGSLAGCSGGTSGPPGDTTGASGGAQSSTSSEDGAAEKPYAGTTIRVLSMTGQISDSLEKYLDDNDRIFGRFFNDRCIYDESSAGYGSIL